MIGGSRSGHGGETRERALFARRARALPSPALPSLEAIVAAADARANEGGAGRLFAGRRAGVVVGLSVLAAACVGGLVMASAHAANDFGSRAIVADFDAGVPVQARRAAAAAARDQGTCEPETASVQEGASCGAPQASFVVASSDEHVHASCSEPEPVRGGPSGAPLSCERETALVCTP